MERRRFLGGLAMGCASFLGACLGDMSSESEAKIVSLELENHREAEEYVFSVEISNDGVVFEDEQQLGPAGSGTDAVVYESPVESGSHTVRVEADNEVVTEETSELTTDEQPCLRLTCYFGAETLHMEHQLYDRCE